jgi:MEMO1 family protein
LQIIMEEKNIKNCEPKGGLIIACFLVLLALCVGLLAAYYAFSAPVLKNKEIKFHSANPAQLSFYENLYKFPKKEINFGEAPVAGVIPHHLLAGDLIAEFFFNLEKYDYDTIILLGPNHFNAGEGKIISSAQDWQTPYGILPVDQDTLKNLAADEGVSVEEDIFPQEHSIYGEVAFIKKTWPRAKFLPLVLRPDLNTTEAENLAKKLYQISLTKKILLISSTDFSHYKASAAAQADDAKSLEILKNYSFSDVYKMAVDSPPASYVLLKYANFFGADFIKLNNSNSALLSGNKNVSSTTSYITGYFAVPLLTKKGVAGGSVLPRTLGAADGVLPMAAARPLKMLFFGDIMLDRYVGDKIKASGSLAWIFSRFADSGIFQGNDLVSANLEGAVTDKGAHYPPAMENDFAFSPPLVGELAKIGFNYFNIANNHLADQGKNGIIETEKNLTNLGFDFAGCPDRQVGDCTTKIIEKDGRKIGLAGASLVYGALNEDLLIKKIGILASSTDLVIVQMHWGKEYQHETAKNQIALAHKFINAGADIVIGHHPHVVGGIEIYQDKPIFYSLGNLVFDQYFSADTQEELGVKINTDGKQFAIKLLSIKSEAMRLRAMNEVEKKKFLEKLSGWSVGSEDFKKQIQAGFIEIN